MFVRSHTCSAYSQISERHFRPVPPSTPCTLKLWRHQDKDNMVVCTVVERDCRSGGLCWHLSGAVRQWRVRLQWHQRRRPHAISQQQLVLLGSGNDSCREFNTYVFIVYVNIFFEKAIRNWQGWVLFDFTISWLHGQLHFTFCRC